MDHVMQLHCASPVVTSLCITLRGELILRRNIGREEEEEDCSAASCIPYQVFIGPLAVCC